MSTTDHEISARKNSPSVGYFLLVIGSFGINILFLSFLFFRWHDGLLWIVVQEPEKVHEVGEAKALLSSDPLHDQIKAFFRMPECELVSNLSSENLCANGYLSREIALGVLEAKGYAVQEILKKMAYSVEKSTYLLKDEEVEIQVPLYSSIKGQDFYEIAAYMEKTAAPFTREELIRRLAKNPSDQTLKTALYRNDDWGVFRSIFLENTDDELLQWILHIPSEVFTKIMQYVRLNPKKEAVFHFLLEVYKENPSQGLADLFVSCAPAYIVTQASDEQVISILGNMQKNSVAGVRLAMRLLCAQRKLSVWKASLAYLAQDEALKPLSQMDRDQALSFLQKKKASSPSATMPLEGEVEKMREKKVVPVPHANPPKVASVSNTIVNRQLKPYRKYIVKKGDTIWSIAKKWNVDVEKLKYLNGLKGTNLTIGTELRIPH